MPNVGRSILHAVPVYHQVYSPGELQFITASTYRRTPIFLSDRFRNCFANRREEVQAKFHFLLAGWVLMPGLAHDSGLFALWGGDKIGK